ncbi:MAG: hypothetical protein ER33_04770 [Cyanobium sp. CACIAM 14]|nr:MAG: hypothetical protein ER33_04770 [Cyanobium sp. CACIAM 14]
MLLFGVCAFGIVTLPSALAAAPSASSSASPQQISYPPGTTSWLLQLLLVLVLGLAFLVILNGVMSRRSNRQPVTSLAREASRLRRLCIGYPEGMTIFEELRQQSLLEDRLVPLGMTISWKTYPSASSLLYDLSRRAIDFCGGGGTASIFAQAAEQLFVRVAREKYPELDADAILVPEDSSIRNLMDLRGKRIAFDEGSSAHYVLVRALESAGIPYDAIEPLLLPQRDALPLFEKGLIDAWVVWMPYAPTDERLRYPGRSIGSLHTILGEQAGAELPTLYYAIPELVRDYPRLLKAILEEVNEAGVIVSQRRLASYLDRSSESGDATLSIKLEPIDPQRLALLEQRSLERALLPLDEPTLSTLQRQANLFHHLQVIPTRVNVRDGTYSLCMRQNWTY